MSVRVNDMPSPGPHSDAIERVTAQHARFLGFLRARVGDPATAEDILQAAYIKIMEHGGDIKQNESTVAWFYRILRNAITDHYRRAAARTRAHESYADETPLGYELELEQTVCACVGDVMEALKFEYRNAIQRVDLDGMTVQAFADSEGTSTNNASVRLHRARIDLAKKLKAVCGMCAEHRCLDCTCRRQL